MDQSGQAGGEPLAPSGVGDRARAAAPRRRRPGRGLGAALLITHALASAAWAGAFPPLCGDGIIEEGETCDDGGTCLGGPNHGAFCPPASGGIDCEGAPCRPAGGDGCAKNCTQERPLELPLGDLDSSISAGSVQGDNLRIPLPLAGQLNFVIGEPTGPLGSRGVAGDLEFRPGDIPIVQRADDNQGTIPPLPTDPVACVCMRPFVPRTCGGLIGGTPCMGNGECVAGDCDFTHGPGNAASGVIGCGSIADVDYVTTFDSAFGGQASFDRFGGSAPAGSAVIAFSGKIAGLLRRCSDQDPRVMGGDRMPCTEDDPDQGTPFSTLLTTGIATGVILSANGQSGLTIGPGESCGASGPCETTVGGAPFACEALLSMPPFSSGVALAGAVHVEDAPNISDAVSLLRFAALDGVASTPTFTPPGSFTSTPDLLSSPTPTQSITPSVPFTSTPLRFSPTPTPPRFTPTGTSVPHQVRTIVVTRKDDSGAGSLRDALGQAGPGDTIDLTGLSGSIVLTSGELLVPMPVRIVGPGSAALTLSGSGDSRVLDVFAAGEVILSGLTVTGGRTQLGVAGGGILNTGTLTLRNVEVRDNAAGDIGGGIANFGRLEVYDSRIAGNRSQVGGGGIANRFATARLQRSEVRDNRAASDGLCAANTCVAGGIFNEGFIEVVESRVTNNTAPRGSAGIGNTPSGQLTLVDTEIDGNTTSGGSGGIGNGGTLTISRSTISRNRSGDFGGGGIGNELSGSVMLENSTVSGNQSTGSGAGIANVGSMEVRFSTVTDNTSPFGGIGNVGFLLVGSTIVARNPGGDCSGSVQSSGRNLDGDDSCGLNPLADLRGADPKLGALGDAGGPTRTHPLSPGSPAIDRGNPDACPETDQRGLQRVPGECDIGAFEVVRPFCPGDCAEDGVVSVDELVVGLNIALGLERLGVCVAVDDNGDGRVDIDELVRAILMALNHCPPRPTSTPTPTPTPTTTPLPPSTPTRIALTSTVTRTATATPVFATATATQVRTFTAIPVCPGDCDGDGGVRYEEAQLCFYGVIEGFPFAALCDACDLNRDGGVSSFEVRQVESSLIEGCFGAPPPPTPTPPAVSCTGDCNDNGDVTFDETLLCALIALERAKFESCPACDRNEDRRVDRDEVGFAAGDSLNECGGAPATPTPILACVGDCNGDAVVTRAEANVCLALNLTRNQSSNFFCPSCDLDGDGFVALFETQTASLYAQVGCPGVPTPVGSPTPTPTPFLGCAPDCDQDGRIDPVDLNICISIALGDRGLFVCPACDVDNSGSVEVEEIGLQVESIVTGCVFPTPTHTAIPTPTDPAPTDTLPPTPTATPPAHTHTSTPEPTDTSTPLPTDTLPPTSTETPMHTPTPLHTHTSTPESTHTSTPLPTNTLPVTPTETPAATATPTDTETPTPESIATMTPLV